MGDRDQEQEVVRRWGQLADAGRALFRCECGIGACVEGVWLPLGFYEVVRQDPMQFVIRPGHDLPDVEAVVQRGDGYAKGGTSPRRPTRATEGPDPAPRRGGDVARGHLVEDARVAAVDALLDQPADEVLVGRGRHPHRTLTGTAGAAGGAFTAAVDHVEAHASGDVGWAAVRAVIATGEPGGVPIRLTLVLEREDGRGWRIVQSHASVPDAG
jgi:ketosteroid isomerase-like protein